MAFEIDSIATGGSSLLSAAGADFVDADGCRYAGFFDGRNVIFQDGARDWTGRWLQGTAATVICHARRLPGGFRFTFMDHGHAPQRLHAVWTFDGSWSRAVEGWKQAGFSVSHGDRYLNRNHPSASIHLRTRGAPVTGADSSHVVMASSGAAEIATGEIHVGEFNPYTGLGVGFLLHLLEGYR